MRRHGMVVAATAAALLLVSGCGSDSAGERRTVTAVVTVSSGAGGASGAASGSASAGGSAAASSSPRASSSAASSSSAAPAPITKVDPLKVDCASILSAADIKKLFNKDIANDRLKIKVAELNKDAGQTGRIRCLYGLSGDKKSGAFSMALTQYTDAAAAKKQVDVTIQNETDKNAKIVPTTVSGYPATMALRDGGLIIMPYDTWTLAIATSADVSEAALEKGLPLLAEAALARILKG